MCLMIVPPWQMCVYYMGVNIIRMGVNIVRMHME